ncbi:unnamed protein product [Pleuronectes platessa]|uniref:Uncharacterized protein n=1 Tax=Pleuronectes platessa TaxID=8262 RepID=A0A9N7YAZ1_PLEPL|nr:unnamed protein product [Pleuronectes platessa]
MCGKAECGVDGERAEDNSSPAEAHHPKRVLMSLMVCPDHSCAPLHPPLSYRSSYLSPHASPFLEASCLLGHVRFSIMAARFVSVIHVLHWRGMREGGEAASDRGKGERARLKMPLKGDGGYGRKDGEKEDEED